MSAIAWSGPPPAPPVRAALDAAGFRIDREAPDDLPLVIATVSGKRIPTPTDARARWIWLAGQAPPEALLLDAALRGAYDVIPVASSDAPARLVARLAELSVPAERPPHVEHLVTVSESSQAIVTQAWRVARTSMSVLLTGETGTGKEIISRLIHEWSPRQSRRFVPINCAAIPNELMEAELFGYARGAFSGAVQAYEGQLAAAEGGTVFLDEIDETPIETQVKLLRVLEDRVISRLGENVWREVDFRLLAATNRDLEPLVADGRFGADLYARLAIARIHLVPLRERIEDLPSLVSRMLDRFAHEQRVPRMEGVRPEALRALSAYPWPGNIRELRNVLYETLAYKRTGTEVLLSDLPRRILVRGAATQEGLTDRAAIAARVRTGRMNLKQEIEALERAALAAALDATGGNASQAATLLGAVGRGASRDPGGTVRAMKRRLRYRG